MTEIDASYADGFVNVARVRVQEGDPDGAQEMLRKAFALAPNLAKAHYFQGLTLKTQGLYDEAIESFRKAAASYPRDRVVRNQIGRVHFLKREFPQAVAELSKTLEVDPEDLEAHYNLMLAYQGVGDEEKADSTGRSISGSRRTRARNSSPGTIGAFIPPTTTRRLSIHEHRNSYGGERPLPATYPATTATEPTEPTEPNEPNEPNEEDP